MGALPVTSQAIAERVAECDQLADDEQQLGLFGDPATEAGKRKLPAAIRSGARGRPIGARNKRTEATVAMLLGRYRDPRAVALERIQMHPADLAAVLGCSLKEADDKQRLWAQMVAPFLHARITPDVIDHRQVIHLTINAGEVGAPAGLAMRRVLEPVDFAEVADNPSANTAADDGGNAGDTMATATPSHKPSNE